MSADKYLHDGQQRILKLVRLMFGAEIEGIAPAEIAREQKCSPSVVTRDLFNLREAGFAERIETTGRWRLGPAMVQGALAHLAAIDAAERKLAETKQRYGRAAD